MTKRSPAERVVHPALATEDQGTIHATTVDLEGRGLLLVGPSGSGKSGVALGLMALGARLVADDRTDLKRTPNGVEASAPAPLVGLIEARGIGLLRAEPASRSRLAVAIDLGQVETERLPPERYLQLLGHDLPLLHKVESPHFVPAVLQYLRDGRHA